MGRDSLEDRDRYLGPYGLAESHRRYQRFVFEWMATRANKNAALLFNPIDQGDTRICELIKSCLDFAEQYYRKDGRPTGELPNLKEASRQVVALFAVEKVVEFGPSKLKMVREAMISAGLSRKVINARVNRIRRIFKWGVEIRSPGSAARAGDRAKRRIVEPDWGSMFMIIPRIIVCDWSSTPPEDCIRYDQVVTHICVVHPSNMALRIRTGHPLVLTLACLQAVAIAEAPHTLEKKRLTLAAARKAVAAAEAAAAQRGLGVVVAVVDESGNLIELSRMDSAQVASVNVGIGKARTAAIYRRPSRVFEEQIKNGRIAALALADATPLQGGVPIVIDGEVVGAVGVSGDSPQVDEEFALAGAAALDSPDRTATARVPVAPGELVADPVAEFPENYRVLFENASVRVLDFRIAKGASERAHAHPPHVAVFLANFKIRFTLPDGSTRIREARFGDVAYSDATVHASENIGDTDAHGILVELKRPGGAVTAFTKVHGLSGHEADLEEHLASLSAPTRAEAGCLVYDLYRHLEKRNEFLRHEVWTSREAFEAHKRTPHLRSSFEKRQREGWTTEIDLWERVEDRTSVSQKDAGL